MEIADICGAPSSFFGAGKRRQQQRGQDADDGDDYQKFDQSKGAFGASDASMSVHLRKGR